LGKNAASSIEKAIFFYKVLVVEECAKKSGSGTGTGIGTGTGTETKTFPK
jgi:hypothetical protein